MEARELRQIARDNLSGNWGNAVLAAFLAALLGGLIAFSSTTANWNIEYSEDQFQALPSLLKTFFFTVAGIGGTLSFVHFIIGGVIRQGYCVYLLKQYDHRDPQINDLFSQFDHFGNAFCLNFLQGLFIFLWSLLLIVPGIIKGYAYAMAPFIMAENPNMTAREALRASEEMMEGHKADLFFLELSFIGWALLSALTLGIGDLWLTPYVHASWAAFYRNLRYAHVK